MQVFSSNIPAPELLEADGRYNNEAYTKRAEAYREAVVEEAKAYGEHKLAGKIVGKPFADGRAEYVVAKVGGKVSLIHLAAGDGWHDDQWCRLMTVKELTRITSGPSLAEIFAQHAKG